MKDKDNWLDDLGVYSGSEHNSFNGRCNHRRNSGMATLKDRTYEQINAMLKTTVKVKIKLSSIIKFFKSIKIRL